MQLQNSYIFLPNYLKEEKKTNQDNEDTRKFTFRKTILSYINSLFNVTERITEERFLKWEYHALVNVDNVEYKVIFIIYDVQKNTYLDVVVEGKTKNKIIICLEYINEVFKKPEIENDFIMLITYDSISEYYCNKLYPKLNELERNIRKLLFNIYVVNFGEKYYQETISAELQKKIKGVIQAKGNNETKEIQRLQMFFYSLEFGDILDMLFTDRLTNYELSKKEKFLNSHGDLSQLTDEELRDAFNECSPRSDWERFFSNKFDNDLIKTQIDEVRKKRNNIAHCKFFNKSEYELCKKQITLLNKEILNAIKITEDVDFTQKNAEEFKKSMETLATQIKDFTTSLLGELEPISHYIRRFAESLQPILDENVKAMKELKKTMRMQLIDLTDNRLLLEEKDHKED